MMENSCSHFFQWVANMQRRTREENLDCCIVITGYEGSGKSTLELILSLLHGSKLDFAALSRTQMTDAEVKTILTRALHESTFDPVRQVAFDADHFATLIKQGSRGEVVAFDEAANGLLAREAMSLDNRMLSTIAMVARAKNLIWILCIPNFHNLDHYFRQFRVLNWIHIDSRGHAVFHIAKRNPYSEDVWWQIFMRLHYPALPAALYAPYDTAKLDYIAEKLESTSQRTRKRKKEKDMVPDD